MPEPIDYEMAKVDLLDVVDAYLREHVKREGQTRFAELIGTKRQGVNAILNRKPGARFTLLHLKRFAENMDIPPSRLLAEMSNLAWILESDLKAAPKAMPEPSPKREASSDAVLELAAALRDLLDSTRKRQP
jgi:hypothetical protein